MEGDAMNRSDRVPASHCVGSLQGQGQPGSPRLEARECFLVECFVLMWRASPAVDGCVGRGDLRLA
jgi:hypothetical protein